MSNELEKRAINKLARESGILRKDLDKYVKKSTFNGKLSIPVLKREIQKLRTSKKKMLKDNRNKKPVLPGFYEF